MWFERFGSSALVRGALHSHHSSSLFLFFRASTFLALFPFYTSIYLPFFIYVSVFLDLGYLLVLSIHTSEWLGKTGLYGMSMGLSGAGLHIKVLAAFSLVLLLY